MTHIKIGKTHPRWIYGVYLFYPLALSWPLVWHALGAIPQGSENAVTVPFFNLWTLGWNFHQLLNGYNAYWQAGIFWPAPGAFAYSDAQPLAGLLAAPWWRFSPALAYNLVLWLYLSANGLTVFFVLRNHRIGLQAALLAGLLAQSLPFLTHERGVLQLQPFFGMLWAVEGLWTLLRGKDGRIGALWLAAGLNVTFLTSAYYGLFLIVLLPTFLPGARIAAVRWRWLVVALVAGCALPLIVLLPQKSILQAMGFERSLETIASNSACIGDYLRLTPTVFAREHIGTTAACGQYLFPGVGLLLLGSVGAGLALRRGRRRWGIVLLLSAILAMIISFGPRLSFWNWQPYEALRIGVPGFENLRSPFRLGLWVQIVLVLCGGITLDALWQRRRWLALLAALLVLVEVFPRQAPLVSVPPAFQENANLGVTLFLPMSQDGATASYAQTARVMWRSLPTKARLVNGYSGYFPAANSQLKKLLAGFPDDMSMRVSRSLGVETLCWPHSWLDAGQQAQIVGFISNGVMVSGESLDGLICYELQGSTLLTADSYQGPWAVKMLRSGRRLQLQAYAAVPDTSIYVSYPDTLRWRLRWVGSGGMMLGEDLVEPLETLLLYHGSDRWLKTRWLSPPRGAVSVVVTDAGDGHVLGEAAIP